MFIHPKCPNTTHFCSALRMLFVESGKVSLLWEGKVLNDARAPHLYTFTHSPQNINFIRRVGNNSHSAKNTHPISTHHIGIHSFTPQKFSNAIRVGQWKWIRNGVIK